MVHDNYPDSKNIVEFFSEDIASIRSAVYQQYYDEKLKDMTPRGKELHDKLDDIYTGLYMNCSPVILIDKDGRYMQEYK